MCLLQYYYLFSGVFVVLFCSFLLLVSPLLIWWFFSVLVWVIFSLFSFICIYCRFLTCSYHKVHIYWPISILVLNRYDLFLKASHSPRVLIFLAENRCLPNSIHHNFSQHIGIIYNNKNLSVRKLDWDTENNGRQALCSRRSSDSMSLFLFTTCFFLLPFESFVPRTSEFCVRVTGKNPTNEFITVSICLY